MAPPLSSFGVNELTFPLGVTTQETLATFIKWMDEPVDIGRSSGSVCHQDPR